MPSPATLRRRRGLPIWGFGITLVVLICGALAGYLNAQRLIANERRESHSDDAIVDLTGLLSTLRDAERSQRGYLLTGNGAHLQAYRAAAQRVQSELVTLATDVKPDAAQRTRFGILRQETALKLAELARTISLDQAGEHAAALAVVRGSASNELMDDIRGQVAAILSAERVLLDQRAAESEHSSRTTIAAIVAPTLIAAALLGLVFFLSSRRMIELNDADRHKDEFLALLAHELRGPLAPLSNGLELIRRSGGREELLQRTCASMERQVDQLLRLINDLLDAGRIAQGKIELRRGPTELGAVIREVLEAKRPAVEAAGLELEATLPAEPLLVDGDPVRLTQVFRNLLENARKYTEPGGGIAINLAAEGVEAVVRVKDTGVGIAADKLDAIFGMFVQINRSLPRSQGGLGIGLALARRLLILHGGSIEAFSEGPGRGSEFVVCLPLMSRTTPRERAGSPTASADSSRAPAT